MSFRRAIKSTAAATMRAGAKGVRIEVAGRLNGAEMSRREKEPLHTAFGAVLKNQITLSNMIILLFLKIT